MEERFYQQLIIVLLVAVAILGFLAWHHFVYHRDYKKSYNDLFNSLSEEKQQRLAEKERKDYEQSKIKSRKKAQSPDGWDSVYSPTPA